MRTVYDANNLAQVLLFHLTNHYALIFALREWRSTRSPATPNNDHGVQRSTSTGTCSAVSAPTAGNCAATISSTTVNVDNSQGSDLQTAHVVDSSGGRVDNGTASTCCARAAEPRVSSDGWTRQILTARKGQRPTAWIDFEEARKIMLGWDGYKIMVVQRGKAQPSPAS